MTNIHKILALAEEHKEEIEELRTSYGTLFAVNILAVGRLPLRIPVREQDNVFYLDTPEQLSVFHANSTKSTQYIKTLNTDEFQSFMFHAISNALFPYMEIEDHDDDY